ncbi:molybdopterin molybdenumtransferase MoeA [Finegoldia sp. BIOML-A2]|uniref:molybdopterin molybdotransferase MoeA n=1 Tax=unclassified Finegoldia TaxID=2619637 RepID=UPI0012B0D87F|nr:MULTISPECIES: molybdopterin molybdotransferase MoeA [unclassified Finegoldia]MSA96668.1 molybdopterin molybdenumtransferase MoeA [Finegoldia sp. BIOML-A5]MSB00053.1 molybdopterin molybdenumtransferase MoeA [Finegoldia sp. BIOML-A2]
MLLQVEKANEILRENIKKASDIEEIDIDDAYNRVLAEDVLAKFNNPPYPKSAMDGYAVSSKDSDKLSKKKIIGTNFAGDCNDFEYEENTCVRIMTGAFVPKCYDAIVKQEDCEVEDGYIEIKKSYEPFDYYIKEGEDVHEGDLLIPKNTRISSVDLSILASNGYAKVKVYRKLKVALLSTGSELLYPGDDYTPGKIYSSTTFTLKSILKNSGVEVVEQKNCMDDEESIIREMKNLTQKSDVVITTGGVSVGDKDLMESCMEQIGEVLFHRIAMKPGTPVMASKVGDTIVLSCSGSPFAAFCNFEVLFWDLYNKYYGLNVKQFVKGKVVKGSMKPSKLQRYVRCFVKDSEITIFDKHKNSMLQDLTNCNALLLQKQNESLEVGSSVDYIYLGEI